MTSFSRPEIRRLFFSGPAITPAIASSLRVWAGNPPEIHSCEGHLKSRFLNKLPETERHGPGSIGQMLENALQSEAAWR
jgi:hypothetical protein